MSVLFFHQSVGADLIKGLTELDDNPFRDRVFDELRPVTGDEPTLVHCRVGTNGDALGKLRHFEEEMRRVAAWNFDLVLFKFCYVDVVSQQAAEALWPAYRECMERVALLAPTTTLGSVTVPLRRAPRGIVAAIRQRISGPHPEHSRNRARHWFNEQLREHFPKTVFDLAGIEAVQADGKRVFSSARGENVPSLAAQWTDDGGHLNGAGRRMAATAFLRYLRSVEFLDVKK